MAMAWTAGSLWMIAVSRDGFRNILTVLVGAAALAALLRWGDRPSRWSAALAGFAVALGFWTYQPLKLLPLLALLWLLWIRARDRDRFQALRATWTWAGSHSSWSSRRWCTRRSPTSRRTSAAPPLSPSSTARQGPRQLPGAHPQDARHVPLHRGSERAPRRVRAAASRSGAGRSLPARHLALLAAARRPRPRARAARVAGLPDPATRRQRGRRAAFPADRSVSNPTLPPASASAASRASRSPGSLPRGSHAPRDR